MPRTVSLHPPPDDEGYTERSGKSIYRTCAQHAHVRPSHTCTVVCNSPTHSLIPLIRSHFRSPWVRPRPFWCHLPLTRRTFTLPGDPIVHVCASAHRQINSHTHTYRHVRAPSVRKGARSHGGGGRKRGQGKRGLRRRWQKEGMAELIPESSVQREEDGERRGVVSRNVGAGEAT